MTHYLIFTKEFTGGLLKGLTRKEAMSFVSVEAACDFVVAMQGVVQKPVGGTSPYRVVDANFARFDGSLLGNPKT
jgi:hypothetical protein